MAEESAFAIFTVVCDAAAAGEGKVPLATEVAGDVKEMLRKILCTPCSNEYKL